MRRQSHISRNRRIRLGMQLRSRIAALWFKELEVIDNHLEFAAVRAVFGLPLVKLQVPFDEHLRALVQILLDDVGLLAALTAIERLDVEENGLVFPLSRLLILAAIVDREAELRDLSARRENAGFRVSGQSPNQHHLIQVRHDSCP